MAKERRLGGLFRARDDFVHATVSTDRRGYRSGDDIRLRATFHNVSSRSLRPEAVLYQVGGGVIFFFSTARQS